MKTIPRILHIDYHFRNDSEGLFYDHPMFEIKPEHYILIENPRESPQSLAEMKESIVLELEKLVSERNSLDGIILNPNFSYELSCYKEGMVLADSVRKIYGDFFSKTPILFQVDESYNEFMKEIRGTYIYFQGVSNLHSQQKPTVNSYINTFHKESTHLNAWLRFIQNK